MSTLNEREAVLRRALLAAAEQVEPAGDGLERIHARMRRPRPLGIAWIEAVSTDLFLRRPVFLQTAFEQVARAGRLAWERFAPRTEPGTQRPLNWMRPLAAMSVSVFVIAVGAYVAFSGSSSFFRDGSNSSQSHGSAPAAPAMGPLDRNGTRSAQGSSSSSFPILWRVRKPDRLRQLRADSVDQCPEGASDADADSDDPVTVAVSVAVAHAVSEQHDAEPERQLDRTGEPVHGRHSVQRGQPVRRG